MKKRVLVYPCGTEIGLEIYKSISKSIHFEVWGGSSTYDHGRFTYTNHIDNLPFITENSMDKDIEKFNDELVRNKIDFLYPAMDGVLTIFAQRRELLNSTLIAPSAETAIITRSKRKTYEVLEGVVPVPQIYHSFDDCIRLPVFIKPDCGQGSVGAFKVNNREQLKAAFASNNKNIVLEYLSGKEYTVDCFTNSDGKLVYVGARGRKRIKNGISVNAVFEREPALIEYAEKINSRIKQKGGWFFQMKRDNKGKLKLLEVAARIAGSSAISRVAGVNLPLLTLHLFNEETIDSVLVNPKVFDLELDRALSNSFHWSINYDTVYVDYDDTLVINNRINVQLISFLYQCVNNRKRIVLLTRHKGDVMKALKEKKLEEIFDEIIVLDKQANKSDYVTINSIFIDDSFGERKSVYDRCKIPVFDAHMIEGLLEERD